MRSPRRIFRSGRWLSEQRFDYAAEQLALDSFLHAVDLVDARIEQLERAIREAAGQGPWRELVARLRCLRGIDTLAFFEAMDFQRVDLLGYSLGSFVAHRGGQCAGGESAGIPFRLLCSN